MQDTINTEGKVVEVAVLASNNEEFAAAARRALTQWQYKPGMRGGIPVDVRGSHSFSYEQSR